MVTIANRYELQDKLGAGGMGEVFRAHDRLTGDMVALKRVLVAPNQMVFNSLHTTSDSWLALAHEFKALASLRHPHIISVLDYGFDAQRVPYFTMEYLPNTQGILNGSFKLDATAHVDLLIQLLQGLAYLHQRGLLHRDLKPGNVMIQNEVVKIIDFGVVVEVDKDKESEISGTLTHLAPELYDGQPASVASDLYAVGLIAYQMFLRKYPFDTHNGISKLIQSIMNDPIDCSELPPHIEPVIARLLAKNPAERFATAGDVIVALSEAINEEVPSETTAIRESYLQASNFVGRETELATLKANLVTIPQGESAFYLVGGESGVGKSRLVDELRTIALVEGFQVLRGQAIEQGGLPWQLWRGVTPYLLLNGQVDDLQAAILKDVVPNIDTLLARPISAAPELTGSAYGQRIMVTLVDLLRQVDQPILLILEDLQWATESLLILQHILKIRDQLPNLMVVGTYRNDEQPNLPTELEGMTVLSLPRLDEAAIAQLTTAMLGQNEQQSEIIEFLTHETEGNTFFMVEVVRALAEEAGNLNEVGRMTLPLKIFTGNMQDLLHRRLAKISERYQPLVQMAAIAGRQIDQHLIETIFPSANIQEWLTQCEAAVVFDVQDNQ